MKVQYTNESLEDLRDIEMYLLQKWNVDVFDDFIVRFYKIVEIICDGKVIFQKYENTNYHKILITKHNTLIYSTEKNVLKIIRIIQNFQDPVENFKSIKK